MFIEGKIQSSKCSTNVFGKNMSFSLSNLHEGANNFCTKLFMVARQDSTNLLMLEYRRLLSK